MKRSDFIFILASFLIWRICLFVFLLLAIKFVPLGENFLGGGRSNYLNNPWLWSWINFDGEHFLSIAYGGYRDLTYFFFPLYPLFVSFLGNIFGRDLNILAVLGLIISNLSFFVALIGFWELAKPDWGENTAKLGILLLLIFPTSFFFASFYSESLFFALVVWSFYFAKKGKWFYSLLLGTAAGTTRLVGLALFAALLPEFIKKKRYEIFLMPLGLFLYMVYLYKATGDPLNFLNTVSIFGPQRSSSFILLPQVFYRYIFKILPNMHTNIIPLFEFLVAGVFLILTILSFVKLKLSYSIYLLIGFLVPTFSGSFSSLPRYVLVLFPAFILAALYIQKIPNILKLMIFCILFICLAIATMFFTRGIWIA